MAVSKFMNRDFLLGWLVPAGVGTAAIQAMTLTNSAGAEYTSASPLPVLASASPIQSQVTPVAGSSVVLRSTPATFYGANITTGASAGYVMLFDLAALPANGTVTPTKVWAVAANSTLEVGYYPNGLTMLQGAVLAFSTTGPFTLTASATAFISGEAI